MIRVKNAFYSCVLLIGTVLALYGTTFISVQSRAASLEPSQEEKVAHLMTEQRTRRERHGSPGPMTGGYTQAVVLAETGGKVGKARLCTKK